MKKDLFISCIYVIDELPFIQYWPWQESLASVLKFADEVIVVHGGKKNAHGQRPSLNFISALNNPKIKILTFPWPETSDWRQIARTCTFGHLHAGGDWCFRVLADEVFPDDFVKIRQHLKQQPDHIKIVSVDRLYLLGNKYACPFNDKPLFFRNDRTIGYGTVNPDQGESASYLLFDDPIETDLWFDGGQVQSIRDNSILNDANGSKRLLNGETPRGYRGESTTRITKCISMGLLNVDVNFYPDDALLVQKKMSQEGYIRLPAEYPHRVVLSPTELGEALDNKIRGMIQKRKLVTVEIPESLNKFIDQHDGTVNRVRRVCEDEYGLPWNEISQKQNTLRRIKTITMNKLNTLW